MHVLPHSLPPNPAAGHHWTMPLMETSGHSQTSLYQSLVGSLLLYPGSWCITSCLCPPEVYFPVLCNFWQLCGGVNCNFLQEDLCHTQVCCTQSPCPCGSPQIDSRDYLHKRDSNTVLSQSLWSPWVFVRTWFVWALWASLAGMGFDFKHEFAPPTILLGLLLCPWTWDISSQPLQGPTAAAPAPNDK